MTTPSGILVTAEEDEDEKLNLPKIVAYLSWLRWSQARSDQYMTIDC